MYYGDGNNERYDCCQYYPARGGRPVCRTALDCAAAYGAYALIYTFLFLCGLGYCSPFRYYMICKIDLLTAFTFLPVPGVVAFPLGGEGMYVRRGSLHRLCCGDEGNDGTLGNSCRRYLRRLWLD